MDFVSLLIWLSGPGVAAISAFVLERLAPFEALSSSGKVVVSITVAGVIGIAAVAAQQYIVPNTELVTRLNPYVAMLVPLFSLLAQQLAHGVQVKRANDRIGLEMRLRAAAWASDDDAEDD